MGAYDPRLHNTDFRFFFDLFILSNYVDLKKSKTCVHIDEFPHCLIFVQCNSALSLNESYGNHVRNYYYYYYFILLKVHTHLISMFMFLCCISIFLLCFLDISIYDL